MPGVPHPHQRNTDGIPGYDLDEHNRALVPAETEAALEKARKAIIAGDIQVADYMAR